MNPDPRFNSCAAPQELSNDEIDRRMDALAAGVPLAPVYYAPPPHPAPRGNKKANAAARGRAAVDDFEGYQPPPRQNARGERTLGQQLPPGGYPPPKQPKQGGKAWEKEEARRQAKAKAEAKKAAEAEEEARWEPPAGFEMGAEREAMLRLLRELFQPRHHAFTQPFVDVTAPEHSALTANLVDIRTKFFAGGFTALAAFALECARTAAAAAARALPSRPHRRARPHPPPHPAARTPPQVREVFAHCYRAHGHPDVSLLSRKCERVDALFEQQVALLNRTLRELASIANARNAVQSGDGGGDDGDGPAGERRSSRASRGSSVLSTLQMVELEKRQEQGRQEAAKREERERERAEAEAWADREVAAVDLKEVRGCYDAVSATHWLLSLGEALGLAAFCPTEFEMALSLERPERCSVVRTAIHTLLSATKPPSSKDRAASRGGAPPGPPGEYALCGALADRIELWRSLRKSAEEAEQDEHRYLFPEQLRPYTEIGEMAELLDGLGDDLGAVAAQLRAHGLGALDLGQMARLLRLLRSQALMAAPTLEGLKTAREVHGAAGLEQWLGTGAAGSGKDAPSTGLVYLPQLRRVYSMSCAAGKSPAWVHPVKDGERVEVEVDEHGTGEVEWRQATVFRLIPGPKGRFQCEVTFADGTPDPDFIETYDRESFEREWRKPPPKAPKKKEAPPEPKKGKGKAKAEEDAKEDGGARARSGRAAATKATEAIKAGPKVVKADEGGAAAAASAASSAAAAAAPATAAAAARWRGPASRSWTCRSCSSS